MVTKLPTGNYLKEITHRKLPAGNYPQEITRRKLPAGNFALKLLEKDELFFAAPAELTIS
mgnify:CR=1 FL=1